MQLADVIIPSGRPGKRLKIVDKEIARIQCSILLALSDIIVLGCAFLGANALYMGDLSSTHGVTMLTVLSPLYLGIAALNSAYDGEALGSIRQSVPRSILSLFFAAGIVLFIAYILKAGSDFSRAVFGLGVAGSLVMLPLNRFLLRRPILSWLGGTPYTTVVIQDGVAYNAVSHDVVVSPVDLGFDPSTRDPISYHVLSEKVAHADRIIIACPPNRYALWSSVLKSMAVRGEVLTDETDDIGIIELGRHGGRSTMVVSVGPLHLRERILKRALDLSLSLVALLLLLPFLVGVAIAIRLDSPGPILFRQKRIGRDNKIFDMFKFRSMYADMCDARAENLTTRGDARVTKVGQFIRRTSIDELPQLFNVLRGEMSIVGPRPHAISAKAANLLYWDVDPRYRHRHSMKPGLTGLAQIRGLRGATDRTEDLTNRLHADLEYVSEWSIWKDLWIIARTLRVVLHDNAF